MNLKTYSAILIVFLSACSTSFGQGRVDSDPILHRTWWDTWKIDNDTTIKYSLISTLSQNGKQNIIAYYTRGDTLYKIIRLEGNSNGTKITGCYFVDSMPALISIKQNNYAFAAEKELFSKTLTPFEDVVDTSAAQNKLVYQMRYKATYYYKNGQLYYSNVSEDNKLRVDKPVDRHEALMSYAEAEQLFGLYPKFKDSLLKK